VVRRIGYGLFYLFYKLLIFVGSLTLKALTSLADMLVMLHVTNDFTFHVNGSLIDGLSCSSLSVYLFRYNPSSVLSYFINAGYKVHFGFSSNPIILLLGLHSLLQGSSTLTSHSIQISGMNSRQVHTLFKVTVFFTSKVSFVFFPTIGLTALSVGCRCCPAVEGATLGYNIQYICIIHRDPLSLYVVVSSNHCQKYEHIGMWSLSSITEHLSFGFTRVLLCTKGEDLIQKLPLKFLGSKSKHSLLVEEFVMLENVYGIPFSLHVLCFYIPSVFCNVFSRSNAGGSPYKTKPGQFYNFCSIAHFNRVVLTA